MNASYAIWTRPSLREQVLHPRRDGKVEMTLGAPSLQTPWQALRLEQSLTALTGMGRVDVNTRARCVDTVFDPRQVDIAQILDACDAAACPANPLPHDANDTSRDRESDEALKRLLVAGVFGMQAMMFALVLYVGVVDPEDTAIRQLFRWLGLLATTPIVLYSGMSFFRHALHDVRVGTPGIDVPIAIAIITIYAASAVAAVTGHGETWFDSVSMLVFALTLGRYLELRERRRQLALNQAAGQHAPLTTLRIGADGGRETVAVAELVPGDTILVNEGAIVPVDGTAQGAASLDTSLHTGESDATPCHAGDTVAAGSIVLDQPVRITVSRSSAASSLSQLQDLTRTAAQKRSTTQATRDVAVPWFIRGTLSVAAATFAFWLWRDPARALDAAVSVLVVACPCAFGLAAPATLTRAMSLLAKCGVRITRPLALAAFPNVTTAVFDKTGTLTQPTITDCAVTDASRITVRQAQAYAAALARESSHPLSRALARAYSSQPIPETDGVRVIAGEGVTGHVDGRALTLGRHPSGRSRPDDGKTLWLSDAHGPLARFEITQTLRPGTRTTIKQLADAGIAVQIMSGDAPERVADTAAQLGIATWGARMLPQDKHQHVRDLLEGGQVVLAVGDGTNDAAALAAASVSASLVDATDLARQHADMLLENQLDGLLLARRMAECAKRTLHQNRGWALAWNTLAIPFAAAGLVPPWLAALGMSVSSLVVIGNAVRMQLPDDGMPPPDGHHLHLTERTA